MRKAILEAQLDAEKSPLVRRIKITLDLGQE